MSDFDFSVFDVNNLPIGSRIVVAMSGGVDSSLTAAALHKMGYDVVGVTLKLYDSGESSCSTSTKRCCASRDIEDARRVAEKIGFPHYVMNYQSRFNDEVVKYFVNSYSRGETPLPCVKCNQSVKFVDLLDCARKLNADALATGHYVKRKLVNGKAEMHRAADDSKDQTYFLFGTTQEQLDFICFPLGGIDKSLTRVYAENFGLEIAAKPDSQDICFVPDGNYAKFIGKIRPEVIKSGDIVRDGVVVGQHNGTINYTIGQRRGIGVSADKPLFVVKINSNNNTVTIGDKNALARKYILVKEMNFLEGLSAIKKMNTFVKIRSTHKGVKAKVFAPKDDVFMSVTSRILSDTENEELKVLLSHAADDMSKDLIVVELDDFEYGVAAGQACVVYSDTRVLGGGWIVASC